MLLFKLCLTGLQNLRLSVVVVVMAVLLATGKVRSGARLGDIGVGLVSTGKMGPVARLWNVR